MSPDVFIDNRGIKFYEVTQTDIQKVIKYSREHNEEPQNIHKILAVALEFKKAGLTPMFLTNEDETYIRITTKELFGKKLH